MAKGPLVNGGVKGVMMAQGASFKGNPIYKAWMAMAVGNGYSPVKLMILLSEN